MAIPNDNCAGCCTCETPILEFFPSIEYTCVSYSGTAEMGGFSGYDDGSYDPMDPEAWVGQGKKWRIRQLSGTLESFSGKCTSCPAGASFVGSAEKSVFTGEIERDETGVVSATGNQNLIQYTDTPDCFTEILNQDLSVDAVNGGAFGVIESSCSGGSFNRRFTESFTLTTRDVGSCGCIVRDPPGVPGAVETTGSASETLLQEVRFYEVLEGNYADNPAGGATWGPLVQGTLCVASLTSQSLTSPEDTGNISKTAVSVGLDVVATGDPNTTYSIYFKYKITGPSPDFEVRFSIEEVQAETDDAGVAEFSYPLPDPGVGETVEIVWVRPLQYRIKFKQPSGCYRIRWDERLVDFENGHALTSLEVLERGNGRPSASLSGAQLVAIMDPSGSVGSVNVLNPGGAFDPLDPPAIVFSAAPVGGTTAEATAVVSSCGQVTGATFSEPGSYPITIDIGAPDLTGATQATATAVWTADGGVGAVTLSDAGSGYINSPLVSAQGFTGDSIVAHFGTETARCVVWTSPAPSGYDPDDPDTWPTTGLYTLPAPTDTEESYVANLRAICDCSTC